ncbi:MAG: hypothetical protein KIT34_09710 [Cyanobacteria bacterium TGS_CYA1]|nr:hypothetical protein [Cyanobacteria bacterium TGS_CYA1]
MSFNKLAMIVLLVSSLNASAFGADIKVQSNKLPTVLRPAVEKLKDSKTPVMLPTWLPSSCIGPVGVGGGPFQDGYEIWLGTCSADTTFFTSGGKGKATKTKHAVKLINGKTAYVQNLKDFCIEWTDKSYVYRVGYPSRGAKSDSEILIKIANSMKLLESK